MEKKSDYDDIINTVYPFPKADGKHPPMELKDRAKIFMPFAALKGYEDALAKIKEDVSKK